MNPVQNSWSIGILKLAYSQSFTSAAEAAVYAALTAGLKVSSSTTSFTERSGTSFTLYFSSKPLSHDPRPWIVT